MTTAIEPELVRRAAAGDRAAAAALLADLRPQLVRYCRARLGRIGGSLYASSHSTTFADLGCLGW
jgi:RNA polymerase sigma-70 factor (ECF subfamily)